MKISLGPREYPNHEKFWKFLLGPVITLIMFFLLFFGRVETLTNVNNAEYLPVRLADSIATAQSRPDDGHSWRARASKRSAISFDEIRFSSLKGY